MGVIVKFLSLGEDARSKQAVLVLDSNLSPVPANDLI